MDLAYSVIDSLENDILDLKADFREQLDRESRRREDLQELVYDLQKQLEALQKYVEALENAAHHGATKHVPNWRTNYS